MPSFLTDPLGTICLRYSDYQRVRQNLARIDPSKVVAVLDMQAAVLGKNFKSFFDVSDQSQNNKKDQQAREPDMFLRAFTKASGQGLISPFYMLPPALLKEETRRNFEKYAQGVKIIGPGGVASDIPLSHMPCFYMGDLLTALDQDIRFDWDVTKAVILGDAPDLLEKLKALRELPDYSQHFPKRPPRNGDPRKQDKAESGWTPGVLQPGF